MKRILILGSLVAAVLSSCASLAPMSNEMLAESSAKYLDGPSQVAPLQLTIDPDFVNERWTLVRAQEEDGAHFHPAPDVPLGLSFGNGLYLDEAGNLVIRIERATGVGPGWTGTTKFASLPANVYSPWIKTVVYSSEGIKYSNPDSLFDKEYTIKNGASKVSVALTPLSGFDVEFQDHGKVTTGGTTYENVSNGVKLSWWGSTFGIPTPASDTFTLTQDKITDGDKRVLVVNNGTYLRFAFTKGNKYSFRIYRTPTTFLAMNESDGKPLFLAKKTDSGWTWMQHPVNGLGFVSDKNVACSIQMTPAP